MAWPNRPAASGIDSSVVTLIAPADSPATVTRRVAAERGDVLCTHRSAASWSSRPRLAMPSLEEQEALGGQPVVDGHADHAVAGERRAVVRADRPDPFMNEPPWIQTSTGRPARAGVGRPHVEVQAVLARDRLSGNSGGTAAGSRPWARSARTRSRRARRPRPGRAGAGACVRAERRGRVGDSRKAATPHSTAPGRSRRGAGPPDAAPYLGLSRSCVPPLPRPRGLFHYLALVDLRCAPRVRVSPWD
jgi:hypothetical protein